MTRPTVAVGGHTQTLGSANITPELEVQRILNGTLTREEPPEGLPEQRCLHCHTGKLTAYSWRPTAGVPQLVMVFWCQSNLCGYRQWMEM